MVDCSSNTSSSSCCKSCKSSPDWKSQLCIILPVFTGIGFYAILYPERASWVQDTEQHWKGWPFNDVSPLIDWYYLLELGCYIHQLMYAKQHLNSFIMYIINCGNLLGGRKWLAQTPLRWFCTTWWRYRWSCCPTWRAFRGLGRPSYWCMTSQTSSWRSESALTTSASPEMTRLGNRRSYVYVCMYVCLCKYVCLMVSM